MLVTGILLGASLGQVAVPATAPAPAAAPAAAPSGTPVRPAEPAVAPQATTAEIYRQLFGNAAPVIPAGTYAFQVDGIDQDDVRVEPDASGEGGRADRKALLDALLPTLAPPIQAQLLAAAKDHDLIGFDVLRGIGLEVHFDRALLQLSIDVPLTMRAPRSLDLGRHMASDVQPSRPAAGVSGYATLRIGSTYVEHSRIDAAGPGTTAADLDAVLNVDGWAAEGHFSYDDGSRNRFGRGDVRLTHDDVAHAIRFELGDLTAPTIGLQGQPTVAGISVFRNFGITPYREIRPIGEKSFDLPRNATVQVYVNGGLLREFRLQSGRYRLRDFPLLSSASNDVELRIRYDTGETQLLSFPAFFDTELLEPGLLDFGFTAGREYRDIDNVPRYDTSGYLVSGYARLGLSTTVTGGLNMQADENRRVVGGDLTWASPFGTFGVIAALDVSAVSSRTTAFTGFYRWRGRSSVQDRSLDLSLAYIGADYSAIGSTPGFSPLNWELRGRYGQNVGTFSRIQVNAGWARSRLGVRDNYDAGVTLTRRFRWGYLSAAGDYQHGAGRNGFGVRLTSSLLFGRSTLTGSYDSESGVGRAQISRSADPGVGGIGYLAGVQQGRGDSTAYGELVYFDNRFEASVQQTASGLIDASDGIDVRTHATFGTSIAFADGLFGIGRPIYDSFALFRPDRAVRDQQIAVEPLSALGQSRVRYNARSGALGAALVPDLSSYFLRTLQVDAPAAPVGSSLGNDVFTLRPGYRSGYGITVGSARNVSLVGTFLDGSGAPIRYGSGSAHVVGKGEDVSIPVFTNAVGRFFIDGVEAGKTYRMQLSAGGREASFELAVPADAKGLFRFAQPIRIALTGTAEEEKRE